MQLTDPIARLPFRCCPTSEKKRTCSAKILTLAAVISLACLDLRGADQPVTNIDDLAELPIEKLMNIPVTILKERGTISTTPAAVSVVTQDDIERSGALNIPEALRTVPGMDVARVNAGQWAVSVRGFNDTYANKLLVLQDGRSLYSQLFSGVEWDTQGAQMMEDIERIEVIRGPGATLWGANAVNGVINILSKSSQDTQGFLASAGGGSADRAFTTVRYGGKAGESAYYRVYGTYFDHADSVLPNGDAANDAWQMGRLGFRTDWNVAEADLITFQGEGYLGTLNQTFTTFDPLSPTFSRSQPDQMDAHGGHVLGRWTHTFSDTSELKLQAYYDDSVRNTVILDERSDTADIDLQHSFALGQRNKVVWGGGYRLIQDDLRGSPTVTFDPTRTSRNLFNAFVQDEIVLWPDRLKFLFGSKFEHNDVTGFEYEPGARLLWTPDERNTLWASVARAVRTPSRSEEDVDFNLIVPGGFVHSVGNKDQKSEELLAYEIGYRVRPRQNLSFDLAAFYNDYDQLRNAELVGFPPPQMKIANNILGDTYGFEASATWEVTRRWRLQPAYTFLDMQLRARSGSTDTTTADMLDGQSPEQQASLRSTLDLPHDVSLDCTVRYVDQLPAFNISSYVTADVRLCWRPTKNLDVAIVGRDLFQARHAEFSPTSTQTQQTEVPRSVYGKITWHF